MTIDRKDCLQRLRDNWDINVSIISLLLEFFEKQPEEKIPGKAFDGVFAIAAQVVLKSGYSTGGALTVTEEGLLHMAQPAQLPNPVARSAPPIMSLAHHYFAPHDIEAFIVVDVPPELAKAAAPVSRIVT